jgi:predicted ribosome quality control (RQC) complex YloA/Tae2 family protein
VDRFVISYLFGKPTAITDRITTKSYSGSNLEAIHELLCSLEDELRHLTYDWTEERKELLTQIEELGWEFSEEVRKQEELVDSLNEEINALEDENQALRTELQSQGAPA